MGRKILGTQKAENKRRTLCVGEKKTKQMIAGVVVCVVTFVSVLSRVLVGRRLSTGNFLRTSIMHGVISRLLAIKESTRLRGPAPFMTFALEGKLAQESLPSLPVGAREEGKHRRLFVMIFGEREKFCDSVVIISCFPHVRS